MRRLNEFLMEDSNQFGPGTDLIISLLSILLVMVVISSRLYNEEVKKTQAYEEMKKKQEQEKSGHFKLAVEYFPAGDFEINPVTSLTNPQKTNDAILRVVKEYSAVKDQYPYIFVIGHSNKLDDPKAKDKSNRARLERNWEYAGRRAAVIAALLEQNLTKEQKEKMIVVTTGEFDMRVPGNPYSQENAWVEIVFGKEWKPPVRKRSN